MSEVSPDLLALPDAPVRRIAQHAAPDARWSPEAIAHLGATARTAVHDEAVKLANRAALAGRKTVQAEDIIKAPATSTRRDATARYAEWLEEVNETYARALSNAGLALPRTPPCPGVPVE